MIHSCHPVSREQLPVVVLVLKYGMSRGSEPMAHVFKAVIVCQCDQLDVQRLYCRVVFLNHFLVFFHELAQLKRF
jgi:hypothetical protein